MSPNMTNGLSFFKTNFSIPFNSTQVVPFPPLTPPKENDLGSNLADIQPIPIADTPKSHGVSYQPIRSDLAASLNRLYADKPLNVDPNNKPTEATRYDSGAYMPEIYNLANLAEKGDIDLDYFKELFKMVPQDPYSPGSGRYKTIARFVIQNDKVELSPHGPMFQSSNYNQYNGGIVRNYQELDPSLLKHPSLQNLLLHVAKSANLKEGEEILVNFQRTLSEPDAVGLPTAEGWHQDGQDIVSVFCVDRENISGGMNYLARQKGEEIFLGHLLEPGEVVTFSDGDCFHYVSPTEVADTSKNGVRDVIIAVYPSMRPSNSDLN